MKKNLYSLSSFFKLFVLLGFITFFQSNRTFAQTDTVFWFAAPEISISWLAYPPGDRPIVLELPQKINWLM